MNNKRTIVCRKRVVSLMLALLMVFSIFAASTQHVNAASKKKDGVTKVAVVNHRLRIYVSHKNLKRVKNVGQASKLLTELGIASKPFVGKLVKVGVPSKVAAKFASAVPYVALLAAVLAARYWVATKVDKGKGVYYNIYFVKSGTGPLSYMPVIGLVHAQ